MAYSNRSLVQLPLVLALLAAPAARGAAADAGAPPRPVVRLVAIELRASDDLLTLYRLGADVVGRDAPHRLRIAATDDQIAAFRAQDLMCTILEADVEAATRRRLSAAGGTYHDGDEVVAELDRMRAARPDLVGPRLAIGRSWEERQLWAVKISDHPERDEEEPAVLFDALHHAREPVGMETLLHAMWHLVLNYDTDPDIRALVNSRELWFVPMVNPDGYAFGGIGGLWRKNRRPNADGSFGVDLNRNYDHAWGTDDLGSSPLPRSHTYRGPYPFSEPETRAMRDFIRARRFVTGMTLHSFGDINLLPTNCGPNALASRSFHEEVAHDIEQLTGYPHGEPPDILYASHGRAQDWAAHAAGMVVIEPEIGAAADGFWPPPARTAELARKNLPALLHMARIAGPHVVANVHTVRPVGGAAGGRPGASHGRDDSTLNDRGPEPGATVEVILDLRNKGCAEARGVTITVTSGSPVATVLTGTCTAQLIPAGTTAGLLQTPILVAISPGAIPGEPIPLRIAVTCPGAASPSSTVEIMTGTPQLLFADRGDCGLDRWVTESGFGLVTIRTGDELDVAFSDSPDGPYRPHAAATLALRAPLDLTAAGRAVLRYRERIVAEPWQDLCFVEARAPGHDWMPLAIIPGGIESRFHEREVSLDAYAGEPAVELRFRLAANAEREADGWTLDDIEVWAFPAMGSSDLSRRVSPALAPGDQVATALAADPVE